MSGLIGRKIGMSSLFDEKGKNIPCTVLELGPCVITQIKTKEIDGYEAFQLGFEDKPIRKVNKSMSGHFNKAKVDPKKKLIEFKMNFEKDLKLGDTITVELFKEGEYVDVSAISKGKGFQGVVKRHGFKGVGQSTHGQHNRLRAPGSIGAASYPARVFKGMRMAGQTGNARVKVENLQVIKVISDRNLILVNGSVPGANNSYITIEK